MTTKCYTTSSLLTIGLPCVMQTLYFVTQVADTYVQTGCIRKPNFPFVFHVNQILQTRQYTSNYLHDKFVFHHNTVTTTIKSYKTQWLEPANNNVNTQRKKFWKCEFLFIKKDNNSMQLGIEGNPISHPCEVAEDFAQYLKTVFNNLCLRDFPASSWDS
jgi:hypothetical protein